MESACGKYSVIKKVYLAHLRELIEDAKGRNLTKAEFAILNEASINITSKYNLGEQVWQRYSLRPARFRMP